MDGVAGQSSAERERSAQLGRSFAQLAVELPWLAPSAASLAAICRSQVADSWPSIRHDPGMVLLLLRLPLAAVDGQLVRCHSLINWVRARLRDPETLEESLKLLRLQPTGVSDSTQPEIGYVFQVAHHLAQQAAHAAEATGCCDPEDAWIAGLLAPLGWMAMTAIAPAAVASCRADPAFASNPLAAERKHWGLDHAALARRLCRTWRLPASITAIASCLDLPIETAQPFGADPGVFKAVRAAVGVVRSIGFNLGLANEPVTSAAIRDDSLPAGSFTDPYQQPWLLDLLTIAAENKRLKKELAGGQLEHDLDVWQTALQSQVTGEAERLRQAKLTALAEFAAGAGHEVNNPLAVISGQAQYLMGHEAEWVREGTSLNPCRVLETIVGQTRRIHSLLRDLMLFARPLPARPMRVDLPTLLGEVGASLRPLGEQRNVRVEIAGVPERASVFVDVEHVKTAVSCLLRNAIEAAPGGGWARVSMDDSPDAEFVEVAVEDSGPGPDPRHVANLFDPFFSGRSAGRGRGLGLPIAWRLAQLHGGDVRLERMPPHGPTCFVLRLGRQLGSELATRILAPEALGLPVPPVTCSMNVPVNGLSHS